MRLLTQLPFLLLPLVATTACTQPRKIEIQDNPFPRQRYEVTLQIHQPPGSFENTARGWVYYRVVNDRCVPLTPFEGATIYPDKTVAFTVTRVSDTVYRGTFFADRLKDQDYYGLGVCHWAINTLGIELKGNGVAYNTAMSGADLTSGKPVPTYYLVTEYQGKLGFMQANGTTNRELFRAQPPGNVFDMTLTTRPAP